MTNLIDQAKSKAVKGPGLKPAGIVVLQFLAIFIFESIEYALTKVGLFTGIVLILVTIAGLVMGRPGTALTNAINPPLAFFFSTIFIMSIFGGAGLHPNRIGLDLVTSMASVAPYLITAAVIGWIGYAVKRNK
jgi:hypothetical protein